MKDKIIQKKIEREFDKMVKLRISGVIKRKVYQTIEIPINKEISINKILLRTKKKKENIIKKIQAQFPKSSLIKVEKIL